MLSKEQQDIIENSIWVVNTALKKQGLQSDEDLRQSALLYMCKCIERFDPTMNIKWTTFAYKNVYLFIKRTHGKKMQKQKPLVSCEDRPHLTGEPDYNQVHDKIDLKGKIATIKALCTPDECKYLDLKLMGYKGAEISQIMGISTSKVVCCMQSIKEKVKEMEM